MLITWYCHLIFKALSFIPPKSYYIRLSELYYLLSFNSKSQRFLPCTFLSITIPGVYLYGVPTTLYPYLQCSNREIFWAILWLCLNSFPQVFHEHYIMCHALDILLTHYAVGPCTSVVYILSNAWSWAVVIILSAFFLWLPHLNHTYNVS